NQHEAGVGTIVDRLGPGVADAVGEVVAQALVNVDQQAVVLGVPARSGFEINGDRESADARCKGARRCERAVEILHAGITSGVVEGAVRRRADGWSASYAVLRIGLIDVEETPKVHATDVQAADADRSFVPRLEFDGGAGLNAVGVL